jgi:hypothetical protein
MAGQRVFRDLITNGRYKGRPKCVVIGCCKPGHDIGKKRVDGTKMYRATCGRHHHIKYDIGDWAYKKYRKNYCENVDGRLGFICTTTIIPEYAENMLDTDHINNNHNDNRKINMQTLCACCHRVKTKTMGHLTSLSYIKKLMAKNSHNCTQNLK